MRVAVVGATGAVGKVLLRVLEERKFPVRELIPFGSPKSEGKQVVFQGRPIPSQVLRPGCFQNIDLVFFDASDAVSTEWAPKAVEAGAWVIDNSGAFRLKKDVPLIVPEVNAYLLKGLKQKLIAGPNCTTVQLVLPLKVISERWGLKRVVVSTYQSVSGAGSRAIEELRTQTRSYLKDEPFVPIVFPHPIAFNCIPQVGGFVEEDETSEEMKIYFEAQKILELPHLKLTAHCVRVPTISCHAEFVNVETLKTFEVSDVAEALAGFNGIDVIDSAQDKRYPMNISSVGRDAVFVGRIRRDRSCENGINLWIVSDNLRKGAALNAIQIAEHIIRQ